MWRIIAKEIWAQDLFIINIKNMMPEKWKDVVAKIKDCFEVVDSGKIESEDEGGTIVEFIEFKSPVGLTRLEFIKKPVILDKQTNYSKRIGSETSVKYIYSEDEFSHVMIAYKWDEEKGDWIEADEKLFS